jgi:hypothetical protein
MPHRRNRRTAPNCSVGGIRQARELQRSTLKYPIGLEPNKFRTRFCRTVRLLLPIATDLLFHGRAFTAPVSHQKQRERNATNAINPERKRSKINERDRYSAAHNGLVAGSSPAGPTSLRSLRELRLGKPVPHTQSEASEGCRAEARRAKAG